MVGDSRAESAPGGLASSDDGDLAGVGEGGVGVDEMQRGLTGLGVSFPLSLSLVFLSLLSSFLSPFLSLRSSPFGRAWLPL